MAGVSERAAAVVAARRLAVQARAAVEAGVARQALVHVHAGVVAAPHRPAGAPVHRTMYPPPTPARTEPPRLTCTTLANTTNIIYTNYVAV